MHAERDIILQKYYLSVSLPVCLVPASADAASKLPFLTFW